MTYQRNPLALFIVFLTMVVLSGPASAQQPSPAASPVDSLPGPLPVLGQVSKGNLKGLKTVSAKQWDEQAVRRVLHTFAYGGQATDAQIGQWSRMAPVAAIGQMLNFAPVNLRLSPAGADDPSARYCDSLEMLQDFWGSDSDWNPMRLVNRPRYATLNPEGDAVSPLHLYLAWSRLVHTPGCNTFLHKMALYITNYHASIHIQNSGPTLIRAYYDDVVQGLAGGMDFVELMTLSATHAALSLAYGHAENHFDETGEFQGNDDFAREYFQLLFGIQGTTEEEAYHENVTIEHNAWLLTGMMLDAHPFAWGSERRLDWLVAPILFGDHYDAAGRLIQNQSVHFDAAAGEASCLEILRAAICGKNARAKLVALGPVAAAHPESMASIPLKIIRFFGDDQLSPDEATALQSAWADANYDPLSFLRAYAVSTTFHDRGTVKLRSAFDRNILIHNANQLTMEEAYAELFVHGPVVRMFEQGALVFAPIRDVFGGQTGADAANDRYVLKKAWDANVTDPGLLSQAAAAYQLQEGGPVHEWRKDWGAVIPSNPRGEHVTAEVADWLWRRFINDGGRNFDPVAKAQVYALLATGFDFGALANADDMAAVYSSAAISSGALGQLGATLGAMTLDLGSREGNEHVGMAINFITALPYTFAMEVE